MAAAAPAPPSPAGILSRKPDVIGKGVGWEASPSGARLVTNATSGYQVHWALDKLHRGAGTVRVDATVAKGSIHVGILDRKRDRFVASCVLTPASGSGSLELKSAAGCTLILSNASRGTVSDAVIRSVRIDAPARAGPAPAGRASAAGAAAADDAGVRKDQLADNRYSGSPPYLFSSWEFIFLFLPVTLSLAALARTRVRWLVGVLVLASFAWYSAWDVRFAPLIAASMLGNWLLGKWVARTGSKRALAVAVLLNLLPLAWFKYTRFAFGTVGLRPEDWIIPDFLPAVLPLGISFYTFQQIGYVVDVRTKPEQQEPSFWRYSLFVLFFPQLVAGPIVQHRQFLPQVGEPRDMGTWFARGLAFFALGVAKKLLIADPIGASIDPYFAAGGCSDASQAWAAIVGYGCQLYFDFSGYSDMAIGLGAMFGFEIPINFQSPYKATSVTDFWRRWHMTLSAFLRDYVYIPLGGNRGRPWTRYRNLMLTMLIGGLWHGAGWAFVLWGGLHGALLAAEHFCRARFPGLSLGWASRPLTLLAVLLLWVPFRAEDVGIAWGIVAKAVKPGWSIDARLAGYCATGLAIAVLAPNTHAIVPRLARWPGAVREAVWGFACRSGGYAVVTLAVLAAGVSGYYSLRWDRAAAQAGVTAAPDLGIDNKRADLRNNMLRVEVLAQPGPKWVVTGPSFARHMPTMVVDRPGGVSVAAGSAGIGGQSLANWVRTSMAICDVPGVEAIMVAMSPVSLTGGVDAAPFRSQGWDMMELAGIVPASRDAMATLGPCEVPFLRAASALLTSDIRAPAWFQLHGYARVLVESPFARGAGPARLSAERSAAAQSTLEEWRSGRTKRQVANPDNGRDAKFGWAARGVLESIGPGGAARRSLEAIRDRAASRGVRLVVYESPTVSPDDAPGYYPRSFWNEYSGLMHRTCREIGVERWDLSRFLPWNGDAMSDFVHPTTPAREVILLELCRRMQAQAERKTP